MPQWTILPRRLYIKNQDIQNFNLKVIEEFCLCVILALRAKRLLYKECEAYLVHVIDKSFSEVTIDSVSVVREFLDMFLEDLLGRPLDRELKFEIELVPGSALISIPLYMSRPNPKVNT